MLLPEKRQVVLKKFKITRQAARRSPHSDRSLTGIDYRRTADRFSKMRYLRIRGFLPKPILQYLKVYFDVLLANDRFSPDAQCPSSLSLGGDPGLDAVLEWARPQVSRLVGFELAPTYSYTRVYAKGEILARHTDRAACEISVTLSIAIPPGGEPSILHLKPPQSGPAEVRMWEGDGCIYAGSEVEHWRGRFRRSGYIQLFLHYIVAGGKNFPQHIYDQRENLGEPYA